MKSATWQTLKPILENALERHGDARRDYLDLACAGQGYLRCELDSLLAHADAALDDFLEAPAALPSIAAPEEPDWCGALVGPFRIIRRIGAGGMGQVFLAERDDDAFDRRVAIKTLRRDIDSPALRRRFDQELRIHASLKHPRIARMICQATLNDQPCMVLEHIDGPPIDDFCAIHRLGLRERIEVFAHLCDAVRHVHSQAVVHRDIKCANVLVADHGEPKLVDFGIAEWVDRSAAGRVSKTVQPADMSMFTPECAAPEQLRNEPATLATDIYGLGLMLYRLLTGQTLSLTQRSSSGLAHCVERAEWVQDMPLPSDEDPQRLRGAVVKVLLKALANDPASRYDSAQAFSDDLRRCLGSLPGRPLLRHR